MRKFKQGNRVKYTGHCSYADRLCERGVTYTVPYVTFEKTGSLGFYACYFQRAKVSNKERMQEHTAELDQKSIEVMLCENA